jgi:hsp70-interacting protein
MLSPMKTLLSFLNPSIHVSKIRAKAVYAVSGLLKHCKPAVQQLQDANGWETLKASLEGTVPRHDALDCL